MSKDSRWEALATEAIHPKSARLDKASASSVLATMAEDDARLAGAVHGQARAVAKAAALMAKALESGGRTFYVGAGTSGRLGVLEAAECPPTYGTDPSQIVAIMAGGDRAVFRSKEGVEDRESAGMEAVRARKPTANDLVVAISASAVTPFVRGAIEAARAGGAASVLITCGSRERGAADVVIAPEVGPELLAGSTRMKAGTATKLILNQMTLLAMIRLKKVFGPYMVDLRPTSAKLRDRAVRMVQTIARVDRDEAEKYMKLAKSDVKTAIVMGRLGVSATEARRRLAAAGRDLRRVLAKR